MQELCRSPEVTMSTTNYIPSPELSPLEIAFFVVAMSSLLILLCIGGNSKGRAEAKGAQEEEIAMATNMGIIGSQKGSPSSKLSSSSYWQVPSSVVDRSSACTNGLDEMRPYGGHDGSPIGGRLRSRTTTSDLMKSFTGLHHTSSRPAALKPLDVTLDDINVGVGTAGVCEGNAGEEMNRRSIYLSAGTGDDLHEMKHVVKKGKLFTLGGHSLMQKAPTVKLRVFTLSRYNMWYVDSYGLKKQYDIRSSSIETLEVRGTRGIGDGHVFFAILMSGEGRSLLLGASSLAYRDEWVEALRKQQEVLLEEEEELSGEEDVYIYKGLPSPAEQSLLLAPLHPRIKHVKEEMEGAVRKRLYSEPVLVDMFAGESSGMKARPNEAPILSPMHGGVSRSPVSGFEEGMKRVDDGDATTAESRESFVAGGRVDNSSGSSSGDEKGGGRKGRTERRDHTAIFSSFESFEGDDDESCVPEDWPES